MNSFDAGIISLFNALARRSLTFDTLVFLLGSNFILKGGVIAALIWWTWFREGQREKDREYLLFGISAGFLALLAARVLATVLPFRERPLRNPLLHFQLPYGGVTETTLLGWSSFPSDHAVLYFALATTLVFVSRGVGIFALVHAVFVISLPRIYMGIHYPTDLVAGALIGSGAAALGKIARVRTAVVGPLLQWRRKYPGLFYACFFAATFQIATGFGPSIELARFALAVAEAVFHQLQ